jgi:hypothetical protein
MVEMATAAKRIACLASNGFAGGAALDECAIRTMTIIESDGWRPVNPEQGDHRIRPVATI